MSTKKTSGAGTKVRLWHVLRLSTLVCICRHLPILQVTPGNRPTVQEGAGMVPSESLANESLREGSAFTENRGIHGENVSRTVGSENTSSSGRNAGSAGSSIPRQHKRRSSGSHGKNVQEGGDWDESQAQEGIQMALNADPGSENDPSRLAEQKMQLKQVAGGRDTGPKQYKLEKKTVYDALGSEVSS